MKRRFSVLALLITYIALFQYIYVNWGTRYHNLGLTLDYSFELTFVAITLILSYGFLSNKATNTISCFISEVHFIIILVPALLVIAMQDYPTLQRLSLMLCLFFGQVILAAISKVKVGNIGFTSRISPKAQRLITLTTIVGLTFYLIAVYGPHLRLSPIDDVHSHRALVSLAVSAPFIGYVLGFLQNAAAPILLAFGILHRNWYLSVYGGAILLIAYMAVGSKMALAQLLIVLTFCFYVRNLKQLTVIPLYHIFVGLLVVVALLVNLGLAHPDHRFANEFAAIVFMRSFALQPAQIGVYRDFFLENPNTYYSHVGIIGNVVDYPYDRSLGITLGDFMGADGAMNANAGIWATDGLAALDLPGLFIAAVLFGMVLLYMKAVLRPEMTKVAACASIPFVTSCANVSLFTSLLTGGGIFLAIVVRLIFVRMQSSGWRTELQANGHARNG